MITPPNDSGGGGSCFPSSVTVALGEPGVPIAGAGAGRATNIAAAAVSKKEQAGRGQSEEASILGGSFRAFMWLVV